MRCLDNCCRLFLLPCFCIEWLYVCVSHHCGTIPSFYHRQSITILAARFSRCRYPRASFRSTLVDSLSRSSRTGKQSMAFSASKTPYSLWQTAQSNHVLPSAPSVALGPGSSRPLQNLRGLFFQFFLRRTNCLLDFIVHMALIIGVSTGEWTLAQGSG